jgi:hypothetical protein
MACLVDFGGADTVSIGTVIVTVGEVEFEYDLRTWSLPGAGPMAERVMIDAVVQKHVRQAMVAHSRYDTIAVKMRRS